MVDRALISREVDNRFWETTGYKPGQRLDPRDPADAKMALIWLDIYRDVLREHAAVTGPLSRKGVVPEPSPAPTKPAPAPAPAPAPVPVFPRAEPGQLSPETKSDSAITPLVICGILVAGVLTLYTGSQVHRYKRGEVERKRVQSMQQAWMSKHKQKADESEQEYRERLERHVWKGV